MKKTGSKTKKLLLISSVIIALLAICFSVSAFAADANSVFTFTPDSVSHPIYVEDYFEELPRSYEAEVNFPQGSYSKASPVISNFPNADTRISFGFEISPAGNPVIFYYNTSYDGATATNNKIKSYVAFTDYSVIGKGWVRIAVVNETDSGSAVYKLYVNGELKQTVTSSPTVQNIDPYASQYGTRAMSIGSDGSRYFQGQLRNLAVYSDAITLNDVKASYDDGVNINHSSIMAYYDSTMSGNYDGFISDQTGHGHDAVDAFFERKEALKDYAYSFAFIGDTQFLVYKDASNDTTQYASPIYDWLVQNKDSKKIARVFGLGDITDTNADIEWEYAVKLHEKLQNAQIPYSIISGNHDDYTTPAAKYNKYFGKVSYFTDSIDGYRIEGRLENYYTDFEVNEEKYTVIALLYGAKDEVLEWANQVAEAKHDRKIIVITHTLLGYMGQWTEAGTLEESTGKTKDNNNGKDIWEKFISKHENIIITASGHISSEQVKHRTDVGVNGNVVHSFLINPQGLDKSAEYNTGMVAMFYFSEDGKDVQVEYVSTTQTLKAQDEDPTSDDILFLNENCFTFKINEESTDSEYKNTDYGKIPYTSITEDTKFALFFNGSFKEAYNTWADVTAAATEHLAANKSLKIQILMLGDYDNAADTMNNNVFNYANGKLTIDLGGHTFTKNADFLNLSNGSDITNVTASNILVKNGTIRCGKTAIIHNQITNKAYTAEKTWNLTLENVKLGYAAGVTSAKGIIYQAFTNKATAENLGTITNITFNNCTFDLKTNIPDDITLFALKDDNAELDKIDVSVKVNGGKILADISTLSKVNFYTLNSGNDSIIFDAYDGSYTKLITHTTEKGYANYTGTLPAADGDRYFVETSDNGSEAIYELTSLKTAYGTVLHTTITDNPGYLSAVDYPFITFKDGVHKFYANDNYWGMTIAHVKDLINGSGAKDHTAVVVLRRDYSTTSSPDDSTTDHLKKLGGTFTIDLAGYTFTTKEKAMLDIYSNSNDYVQDTTIIIKNGTLINGGKTIVGVNHTNKQTTKKSYFITFEDVRIKDSTGSSSNITLGCWDNGDAAGLDLTLNFNDCIFDYTGAKSGAAMIHAGNNKALTKTEIYISGGQIIANKLDSVKLWILGTEDIAVMKRGSDGLYTTLSQSASQDAPTTTYLNENGDVLTFSLKNTNAQSKIYQLGRIIDTAYGQISGAYDSEIDYPFALFTTDKKFIGGYADFGDAIAAAIKDSSIGNYIVLLRRNTTVTNAAASISTFEGSITVDLNGHTITTSGYLLDIYLNENKSMTADKTYGTYKLMNGTLARGGKKALVDVNYGSKFSKSVKYVLEFTNVTFKATGGDNTQGVITHSWEDGYSSVSAKIDVTASFNNCTFDFKNSIDGVMMLPTNYSDKDRVVYSITINGGEIITKSESDMTRFTNVNTGERADTIIYGKTVDGNYIALTVASGIASPADTYATGVGNASFVKISEDADTVTYRLRPTATAGISFAPKMSITLGNALIINVYAPANDSLQKIEFNGVEYTLSQLDSIRKENIGSDLYYVFSVALDSSKAADTVTLKATFTLENASATARFTFSIPEYATKVLDKTDVSETEKTLVLDVLAYIKAAYVYFDAADKDEVAEEIDAILGNYSNTFSKVDGTASINQGLYAVEIALEEMPKVRFILPAGVTADGYTFKSEDKELAYTTGTVVIDSITYNYAEISLYAYQMIKDITYSGGTASGSYHINSYYDFVTTDDEHKNNSSLITLVEKFYNYCKSANDYKISVTD